MKSKLTFVIGMGVGYVLGARAGRSSYERLKSSVKAVWNKDQVQETVSNLQENLKGQAGNAVHALVEQVLPSTQATPHTGTNTSDKGETRPTASGATPPDTVPEVSDEFPDAALDGGEAEQWTRQARSSRPGPATEQEPH